MWPFSDKDYKVRRLILLQCIDKPTNMRRLIDDVWMSFPWYKSDWQETMSRMIEDGDLVSTRDNNTGTVYVRPRCETHAYS